MRYSKLFGKTTKTISQDDKIASSKLLVQAGYIRESVAGRYFILPLAQAVQQRIMAVIKEEMDAAGAQEMISPILHPLDLWKETNRTNTAGFELMKVSDRRDAEFALGGTAEEMFVDVVRKFNLSYRDLPFHIYQFSPKFRDELRARGGLLRVREFIMKDSYSFDRDEEEFKKIYEQMGRVYANIFKRLGLETMKVESDNGYIGGDYCHEYVVDSSVGETRYLTTKNGSYAAHEEVAVAQKEVKNADEAPSDIRTVEAVRGTTMEDGVKFHKLPLWQQIKDVMYVDENGRFVLAIIRGDYDVNEIKLKHLLNVRELTSATDEDIRQKIGSEPGFISPVGIKDNLAKGVELIIVADDSLRTIANAYGGANKKNTDLHNINIDRDYKGDIEGDIAMARVGDKAVDSGEELIEKRGIEVGNIFQLGLHYTNLMKDATFMDDDGKPKPYYMGCYGIGVGRTMAAIVEAHHDDRGIMWPSAVTPFDVHLVALDLHNDDVKKQAEDIYSKLEAQDVKLKTLYDDRPEARAGEKFADADLIGIPHRVVISKRTGDKLEYKRRGEKDAQIITVDELLNIIANQS